MPCRSRTGLIGSCALLVGVAACGAETLCATTGFEPTPLPRAVIRGRIGGLPGALADRLRGVSLKARALSVDGVELASATVRLDSDFEIALAPGQDHFNVKLCVEKGGVGLRTLIPEAPAGAEIQVGTVGASVTAHAILAERSAELERGQLASMPPQVLAQVLRNASQSEDADVESFRRMARDILEQADPAAADPPAFVAARADADDHALAAAALSRTDFEATRDRAARAIAVPVVCDPARLRVLFTCDVSGQALDGNGAVQFIRQAPKAGKVFLGITLDPLSPVADVEGVMKRRLTPNDPDTEMFDDGTHGDEVASDKVFSRTLDLPRGIRVIYKYTDGSAGEGFTGTEEWPGNARILQVEDVLTGVASGAPDCIVVRRDSFGDESTNKNFVNLNSQLGGGALGYDDDLGGGQILEAEEAGGVAVGGLALGDIHGVPPLSPAGVAEARENGTCQPCPPPLTVASDDREAPRLVSAAFTATDRIRVGFSEDLDLATASDVANYVLAGASGEAVPIAAVQVRGAIVTLEVPPLDPTGAYDLSAHDIADASADKNLIEGEPTVRVGPDLTPPSLVSAQASSITELNPAARPVDPRAGEVVVLEYDEVIEQLSAENAVNYRIDAAGSHLAVHAAFQRGRKVLLVTAAQEPGARYTVSVDGPFDWAGNLLPPTAIEFTGLELIPVVFQAVVDYAFLTVDGAGRGLPSGDDLYLTGTVLSYARGVDGADLRIDGRTDVAGIDGFRFTPDPSARFADKPVHRLELLLPPGTYAWKAAHGHAGSAVDAPATLEAVTKGLATSNDNTGVAIDPITLMGRDGVSYAGARLSLNGTDTPSPEVIFKRENPDEMLAVTGATLTLPVFVISAWRDVPFGQGRDYDDGLLELPQIRPDLADQQGPALLEARAPCSEGVMLSFDEAVASAAEALEVSVADTEGRSLAATVQYVGSPVRPTQVFVQTEAQFPETSYNLEISGVRDGAGNTSPLLRGAFVAPGANTVCTVVDQAPPALVAVEAPRPDRVTVRFSERIHSQSASVEHFAIRRVDGDAPLAIEAAVVGRGGTEVVLTTARQEIQARYRLTATAIADVAQPANLLESAEMEFTGFGDHVAPTFVARAVTPELVWLRFDEPLDEDSAVMPSHYSIDGLEVRAVEFSGSKELRASTAKPDVAPLAEDQVLLSTGHQSAGRSYTVHVDGVMDLSQNPASASASFTGVDQAPVVDLVLEYLVSRSATVFGAGPGGGSGVPGRALSPETLAAEREGVFIRGGGYAADGATRLPGHPVTAALGGFPERGVAELQGFAGPDPQLLDDGVYPDRVAGDNVYTIAVADVPLGSVIAYKALASFSVAYRDANPSDARAALADPDPGPSQYADGEEFPGNDNGCRIVADSDGDGVVVLQNLLGDEVTYKRTEDKPVFVWVDDEFSRAP